jgi:folate-binding protein YgfZ
MNAPAAGIPRFFDPGPRAVWELRGPDAVRYLNGQVTNDVSRLAADRSLPAYVTDAKGRLQAVVRIARPAPDRLLVEAPPQLREPLGARLGRYLVADDVELTDCSEEWRILHWFDQPAPAPFAAPPAAAGFAAAANRLGLAGCDWWAPAEQLAPLLDTLRDCAAPLEPDAAEALRIGHGVPAWGAELVEGMLAPEAGIDSEAISYRKGCYIGQEVISRVRSAGKLNRRLVRLLLDPDLAPSLARGAGLSAAGGGEPAGRITSVSPATDRSTARRPALGFLSRQAEERIETPDASLDIVAPNGTRHPGAARLAGP